MPNESPMLSLILKSLVIRMLENLFIKYQQICKHENKYIAPWMVKSIPQCFIPKEDLQSSAYEIWDNHQGAIWRIKRWLLKIVYCLDLLRHHKSLMWYQELLGNIFSTGIKILHRCIKMSSSFYVAKSGYKGQERREKMYYFPLKDQSSVP